MRHFHCCSHEKMIRWFQVTKNEKHFDVKVTKPASLAPGEDGQRQLLTVLCMSSPDLDVDIPLVVPDDGRDCTLLNLIGEGATSHVYCAVLDGKRGAIKMLRNEYVEFASIESALLQTLELARVPGVPKCEIIAPNALFFDKILAPIQYCSSDLVAQLLACLKQVHKAGVVHRDVRPDNVMMDSTSTAVLNDWGCSSEIGKLVPFQGTCRYASEEVLVAAMHSAPRAPQPKDDLHALVRTVLALNDPSIRTSLLNINGNDFATVIKYWNTWKVNYPYYVFLFDLAENLNYDELRQLR